MMRLMVLKVVFYLVITWYECRMRETGFLSDEDVFRIFIASCPVYSVTAAVVTTATTTNSTTTNTVSES